MAVTTTKFYAVGNKWLCQSRADGKNKYLSADKCEVTIDSSGNVDVFDRELKKYLFTGIPVTSILKSDTEDDFYTDVTTFLEAIDNFFVKASGDTGIDIPLVFYFDSAQATTLELILSGDSGEITTIDWGDGTTVDVTHDGTDQTISNTYTSDSGVYTVRFEGDYPTKIDVEDGETGVLGDISALSNLTYYAHFSNADVSGDISALANLTYYASFYNTDVSVSTVFAFGVTRAYFSDCDFDETEVQYLLESLVLGGQSNGICGVDGTNANVNAAALTAISTLESNGWTVTYNQAADTADTVVLSGYDTGLLYVLGTYDPPTLDTTIDIFTKYNEGVDQWYYGADANPRDIVYDDNYAYIADNGYGQQLIILDRDYAYVANRNIYNEDGISNIEGIAVDGNYIYVTARDANVHRYTFDGTTITYVDAIDVSGQISTGFTTSVAVGNNGNLYVMDNSNDEVYEYNTSGVLQDTHTPVFETTDANPYGLRQLSTGEWLITDIDSGGNNGWVLLDSNFENPTYYSNTISGETVLSGIGVY